MLTGNLILSRALVANVLPACAERLSTENSRKLRTENWTETSPFRTISLWPQDSDSPLQRAAVGFPCHDHQCHTHSGKLEAHARPATQTGNPTGGARRRPALECRGRARRGPRWRIRLRRVDHRGVLPAFVCGAPPAPGKRAVLPQTRAGRAGRISSLSAVPAQGVSAATPSPTA